MALVTSADFQLTPDILGAVSGGLQTAGQLSQLKGQAQARDLTAQTKQLTGVVLDQSLSPAQRAEAQKALTALNPQAAQQLQTQQRGETKRFSEEERAKIQSISSAANYAKTLPTDKDRAAFFGRREAGLVEIGKIPDDTQEFTKLYNAGDFKGANEFIDRTIALGQSEGFIKGGANGSRGAGIKSFAPITIVNKETGEKSLVAPTVDPSSGKAILEPFAMPEGFEVSKETAEEKRAADVLAVGAKEVQKLSAQLMKKPQIEKAVTEARAIAANRGEAFTELSQAKAALPGLTTAVDNLRELSSIATSTFGGKVFDTAVKESGFGATKGATARAKFIAIINNQVLPLLKPTFGAAFTVQEGEALKATMGDPDASPEAKMAQLDAFIDQKVRDIKTKESVLQQPEQGAPQAQQPEAAQPAQTAQALPQGITEDDIAETMRANNMTREQVLQRLSGQ